MRTLKPFFFAFAAVFLACGSLAAGPVTLTLPATGGADSLPMGDVDTLSIQLSPTDGAVDGVAGATVGWGFIVNWNSTNGDWISFTGSSLGSPDEGEMFPGILAQYTSFISQQGGPYDLGLSSGSSPWTEPFDGISQGVGSYQIAGGAAANAIDSGEITFNFEVYDGDPTTGTQIGDLSQDYSYYGTSTEFSVTVDASTPEPGSIWLFVAAGLVLTGWLYGWRPRQAARRP